MQTADLAELRQKLVTEVNRTKAIKAAGGKPDLTRQNALLSSIHRKAGAEAATRNATQRAASLAASVAALGAPRHPGGTGATGTRSAALGASVAKMTGAAPPGESLWDKKQDAAEAQKALESAQRDVDALQKKIPRNPEEALSDALARLAKAKKAADAAQKALDAAQSAFDRQAGRA